MTEEKEGLGGVASRALFALGWSIRYGCAHAVGGVGEVTSLVESRAGMNRDAS